MNHSIFIYLSIFYIIISNLLGAICLKSIPFFALEGVIIIFPLLGLGIIYILRTLAWVKINKLFQLSFIYPFTSLSYLISYPIGIFVFNETLQITKILGTIIISLGVFLLVKSENQKEENIV